MYTMIKKLAGYKLEVPTYNITQLNSDWVMVLYRYITVTKVNDSLFSRTCSTNRMDGSDLAMPCVSTCVTTNWLETQEHPPSRHHAP